MQWEWSIKKEISSVAQTTNIGKKGSFVNPPLTEGRGLNNLKDYNPPLTTKEEIKRTKKIEGFQFHLDD